jgi:hypothetical protein
MNGYDRIMGARILQNQIVWRKARALIVFAQPFLVEACREP